MKKHHFASIHENADERETLLMKKHHHGETLLLIFNDNWIIARG